MKSLTLTIMQYLVVKSLFPSFFIWQTLSMSQFALNPTTLMPTSTKIHKIIFFFSVSIQIGFIAYGFYNMKLYINTILPPILLFTQVLTILLNRILVLLIVFESRIKRFNEIKLLNKIVEIDQILIEKLQIDVKYKQTQHKNIKYLIIRLTLYIYLSASAIASIIIYNELKTFRYFWIFVSIPIFISSMRYHQAISYVYLIAYRYQLIRNYVKLIQISQSEPVQTVFTFEYMNDNRKNLEAMMISNKLTNVRDVYRLLLESNEILSNLFNWSLLLSIANDFQNTLACAFFLIFTLIKDGFNVRFVCAFSWPAFGIVNFIMLANGFQFFIKEVGFRRFNMFSA